ncbi:MBL fold metallo-hydrolase [Humisphaera borealis]|uniref:MBL fold metallo-hydrolase n=1 Tax=Humisphaera borealis TaxID=2807512 RepID=A0A7M2X0Q2_9BACT|nr:MBL fold metallo-hydrolase [Humisphaera borealis]QOV91326.1 MBL fold metallo-hydrolase [Humisphaera borealis]
MDASGSPENLPAASGSRKERPGAHWKVVADWAKARPWALAAADRLGRSRGRLAVVDRLMPPPPAPLTPDLSGWNAAELAAVWIGHATILLRIGGQTVLTDPVFAHRIGLGLGLITAGPRRRFAPAVDLRKLPPIDLILMSHAHFDHLDRPTLARLPKKTPIVTAPHTRDLLKDLGYASITELRWKESTDIGPLRITAEPVRHWGARTFHDAHRGYNAYQIESRTGPGRRVFFGGDSAHQELWRDLPRADLAIVGIGGYRPHIGGHANPEQAWEMIEHLKPDAVIPMHHSTFKLSHEPWGEPMERLMAVADARRVVVDRVGGMWMG